LSSVPVLVGCVVPAVREKGHVEPGTRVITDGWQGYSGLEKLGYVHERRSQRATHPPGLRNRYMAQPRQLRPQRR